MSDEWGPWIEHDGKGCPCVGQFVHIIYADGEERTVIAGAACKAEGVNPNSVGSSWVWLYVQSPLPIEIIRYRIRKPRALLDLIERARELDNAPQGPVRAPALPKVPA